MADYERAMKNLLFGAGPKVSLQLGLIVLHLYNEGGAMTTRHLANYLNSCPAGILHIIKRLERSELVEKKGKEIPEDRNWKRPLDTYGLTDKAIDILESDDIFGYEDELGCQFPS